MSGVFQVDRDIFNNSIWQNQIEFRLFFYILGNAVWKEEGKSYGDVFVGRGQYLRSFRNLREDLAYMDNNTMKFYGMATIKRNVDKLVKDGRLEKEETRLGTLFTVVNYSKYQSFSRFTSEDSEQGRNTNGTPTEQGARNTNGTPSKIDNNSIKGVPNKDTRNTDGTPFKGEGRNNKKYKNNKNKETYIDIVEYLNKKTGRSFKTNSKSTTAKINARLEEGFTLDDFKKVIDTKSSEWLSDANMQKYLRPETLFGTKFEGYLNEDITSTSKNESNDPYAGLDMY